MYSLFPKDIFDNFKKTYASVKTKSIEKHEQITGKEENKKNKNKTRKITNFLSF